MVVFCEYVDEGDVVYRYHPVRKVMIEDAPLDPAGNLSLILRLGGFFRYRGKLEDDDPTVSEFQRIVGSKAERPHTLLSERLQPRKARFVCVNGDDWKADQFDGEWETLVAHMGRLKGVQDSYFLRLTSRSGAAPDLPAGTWEKERCRLLWEVRAGKSYELSLRMHLGEKAKSDLSPALTIRDELVIAIGPFARQFCGGVEVDYLLDVKPAFQQERTTVTVRVEPNAQGGIRSAEIQGALRVVASKGLLVWAIVLLAIGTLLQGVIPSPDVAETKWHWDPEWASRAFFGCKVVGTLMVAAGAYLGFRKLPFKLS